MKPTYRGKTDSVYIGSYRNYSNCICIDHLLIIKSTYKEKPILHIKL